MSHHIYISSLPPPRQHISASSDFWFNDGNIVLVVKSSAFKVHIGVLDRYSQFFRDLFSLPRPPEKEEQDLIDGCVWVELHDDPLDWFHFIGALYDGFCFQDPRTYDYSILAAVMRISTKYIVEHLRKHSLKCLECDFPPTLEDWDIREAYFSEEVPPDADTVRKNPLLVLEIALELDAPSLLPATFYELSRYAPSDAVSGRGVPSGRVASHLSDDDTNADRPQPSCDLLFRILRGREHGQEFIAHFIATELTHRPLSDECRHQHDRAYDIPCITAFSSLALNTLRSVMGVSREGRDADPLFTLESLKKFLEENPLRMCEVCQEELKGVVDQARRDVWALLPRWFGFDNGHH